LEAEQILQKDFSQTHTDLFGHTALKEVGILFVGHGTRVATGQLEFQRLFQQFEECVAPVACQMAYLELAQPDIPEAIAKLAATGHVRKILVVPALLFTAGHAESDIPDAVHEALQRHDVQWIGQTDSLECSPGAMQLSARRFRQAVCPPECVGGCTGAVCSRATWILIGRGSSSPTAAFKMRQFTRKRQELTPVQNGLTAFIYGQKPSVEATLEAVSSLDTELVVVQPHLLFSGILLEKLQAQVAEIQAQNEHQKWVITEPLGADRSLAELWARMALDALEPEISRWELANR
jgi:sirohydrochlorin cobaltochelatase